MSKAASLSKVPAVTLGFWIIKILATALRDFIGKPVACTILLSQRAAGRPRAAEPPL